jgi:hypothetical protein
MSFPDRSVPITRAEIVVRMQQMFGGSQATFAAYLPVVDLALGMTEGGSDFWQDPKGDHATEVASNLRFAASEISNLASAIEESRGREHSRD